MAKVNMKKQAWFKEQRAMMDLAFGNGKPRVALIGVEPEVIGFSRKDGPIGGTYLDDLACFEIYTETGDLYAVWFENRSEDFITIFVDDVPFQCAIHQCCKMGVMCDSNGILITERKPNHENLE